MRGLLYIQKIVVVSLEQQLQRWRQVNKPEKYSGLAINQLYPGRV